MHPPSYTLGGCSLGGYSLVLPILDRAVHLPQSWRLQSGGIQSRSTDFGSRAALTRVREATV